MTTETRRLWTIQEDQAIKIIVQQLGTKRWSDISQIMQDKYQLYGRTGKQCRQRWHNHLAPQVNKRPWSSQEEQILFDAHKNFGNKWTQISKLIEGRTDNAIKNHFYSSIRKSLRRINKILGSKNSTLKMRNIKPTVLAVIFNNIDYQDESNSQDYKNLASALIQFSKNRIKKQICISNDQKQGLQNIITKLMEFNDRYQKDKKINKKIDKSANIKNQIYKSTNCDFDFQKINQLNHHRKCVNQEKQDEEDSIKDEQQMKEEPSIVHQHIEEFQDHTRERMNLQKSEYDWEEFQQRCQTIVNRYLISQNSLKSMESLPIEQIIFDNQERVKKTPIKLSKQSLCSSTDVMFQKAEKNH